ncbi:hypothetical protein BuS5_02331 [Desulfosarcina sp. BuS5]|nr:hypothetical protein BuS5_02331 [Desulfosarcina sp. BuS5]
MQMNGTDNSNNQKKLDRICPFIQNPHKDCHCVDMNSRKVNDVIYYCQKNFKKCKIYKRLLKERQHAQNTGC